MALTVLFIVILGTGCLVPVVWALVGIVKGNRRFWPTLLGLGWALALMQVTIIGISSRWGECASASAISEGSVRCAVGDQFTSCAPDVWALECHEPVAGCGTIADGSLCPAGAAPVFSFCEHMQTGGVKQPWATWSDLAFVAAGLWLLWFLPFASRRTDGAAATAGEPRNPMREIGWLSIGYCLIVIFMGPPSMWYHASAKDWAGWFDSMSVVFWLMFNALYVLYTLAFAMWNRGRGAARRITVLAVWVGLAALSGIIAARFPHARIVLYFLSGGLWGAAELACAIVGVASSKVVFRRTWWLFALNLGLLAVTMTLWMFFNDSIVSATSCQARESFPGHAVFHILASISTVLTYLSFTSEKRTPMAA